MFLIHASEIVELQQNSIADWKDKGIVLSQEGLFRLVEENHALNLQLWQAEDRARREDMGHQFVYHAKREIDHCNQQRNNRVQDIDEWLITALNPASSKQCPVNSETPGMIIDRLSILALKRYHMYAQTQRQEVGETHRLTCLQKSKQIELQQNQLARCLDQLLAEIKDKTRTFSMYYQYKMYNDPSLNPELYNT